MFWTRHQSSPTNGDPARPRWPVWVTAVLAAGASGALMATCFSPLNLHFVAWIALVPWLAVLPGLTAGRAWLYGTVLGLVFYRLALAWLLAIGGPVGGAVIVVFAVWMGLSFRVAKLLMDRFGTAAMLWAVPLTFAGQEVLRCEALSRYRLPFGAWGYSQSHNLWIAQIASIGGVHFVSLLLVGFSTAVAYALRRRSLRGWAPVAALGAAVPVLGLVAQPRSAAPAAYVPAACVQAETFDDDVYVHLTAQALNDPLRPAFVVLPEHAIMEYASERHPVVRRLATLAREHGAFICVGAHVRPAARAECYYDNVAMLIGPDGKIVAAQAKAVPLPFFEDGNPARSLATTETPYGRLGMCVCYDVLFTDIPRQMEQLGAQLLLVPVMDPERWPLQERRQHADMAPFRSIELRRYAVRAASSGISQIIDPTGRVCAQRTKEEGPGILCGRVGFVAERTLFARGGYLFNVCVAVGFLAAVAVLTCVQWCGAAWRLFRRLRGRGAVAERTMRALAEGSE